MAVDVLALCHPLLTNEIQAALDHAEFDYKAYLFPFVNLLQVEVNNPGDVMGETLNPKM